MNLRTYLSIVLLIGVAIALPVPAYAMQGSANTENSEQENYDRKVRGASQLVPYTDPKTKQSADVRKKHLALFGSISGLTRLPNDLLGIVDEYAQDFYTIKKCTVPKEYFIGEVAWLGSDVLYQVLARENYCTVESTNPSLARVLHDLKTRGYKHIVSLTDGSLLAYAGKTNTLTCYQSCGTGIVIPISGCATAVQECENGTLKIVCGDTVSYCRDWRSSVELASLSPDQEETLTPVRREDSGRIIKSNDLQSFEVRGIDNPHVQAYQQSQSTMGRVQLALSQKKRKVRNALQRLSPKKLNANTAQ